MAKVAHVSKLKRIAEILSPNYKPSIYQLEQLLRDENQVLDLLADIEVKGSFITEVTVIALFTTRPGISLLNCLTDNFGIDEDNKDFNPNSLLPRMPQLALKWMHDELILIKFLRFIIDNRNMDINFKNKNDILSKLQLDFLIKNETSDFISLNLLTNEVDVVREYLTAIWPKLKNIIKISLNGENEYIDCEDSFFVRTILSYKRLYETLLHFEFYDYSSMKTNGSDIYVKALMKHLTGLSNFSFQLFKLSGYFYNTIDNQSYNPSKFGFIPLSVDPDDGEVEENQETDNILQPSLLDFPDLMNETAKRHLALSKLIIDSKLEKQISNSPLLQIQYKTLLALIDPLTQPVPNDTHVISIDLLCNMFLGLMKPYIDNQLNNDDGVDWRFHICFNMQQIIIASLFVLNCNDFERLGTVDESKDWRSQLHLWLPRGLNTQNLELVYMSCILAVYTIYKLYSDSPVHFNPFLSSLISLWKSLTCVVLYGLQIDRLEESNQSFDTPIIVRATIRGAAALRSIVATVLNEQMELKRHDFIHESLNTFMSPHGRKLCDGALYADLKAYTASILALGAEFQEVTDLVSYLQAGDQFDEDVKYMFEYEYEDYNEIYEDSSNENEENEEIDYAFNKRRCNCIFSDDNLIEEEEDDEEESDVEKTSDIDGEIATKSKEHTEKTIESDSGLSNQLSKPHAVRSKSNFEFDYSGKDWRDIPREYNLYYSPFYNFIDRPDLNTVFVLTLKATSEKLTKEEAALLLCSVASTVKNEQDRMIFGNLLEQDKSSTADEHEDTKKEATPDDIYEIWCEESAFERILHFNPDLAWKLMDEMLMCSGYRRVLIWFITHMELSHSLIIYIFDLMMGSRGINKTDTSKNVKSTFITENISDSNSNSLKFSRMGHLKLSELETRMILQELFTNAAIYFSDKARKSNQSILTPDYSTEEEEFDEENEGGYSIYSVGLMKLICIMVSKLIENSKFNVNESDCVFELQTLLMGWISILPEAKELSFKINSSLSEFSHVENSELASIEGASTKSHKQLVDKNSESYKYNEILLKLIPPTFGGKEENIIFNTFRDYIKDYSFDSEVSTMCRKIIHQSDEILPLQDSEKPFSFHDYLTEYGKAV
ncbi:hypothetical protein Kpol_480p12 [Vanderwaltozyma polyspora DSM 70294]|uniref:Uncharacterized protein n=1 Tax=Vanderwaltozyma polyspora (strain ATCC 22028 / DSM 70294 / BCRC 21397 / CBS 2163 / NBRC 10782 / NRRL Y-8283 / UCD 57-17) TaxID=436907 RepID=A7TP74_VANPO|nr:uncharacterized protein Kpol_480p12 [Vanderwaltozyma polyspora DSM 70294]EDO15925.1 hypothetical protein Kpol_480p12 [Vanderwaltozyma polyspora DSM 70294]